MNNPSDVDAAIGANLMRLRSLLREVRGMRLMIVDLTAVERADLSGQEEALKAAIAVLSYKENQIGTDRRAKEGPGESS